MPKVTAIVSKVTNGTSLIQGNDYEVIGIDNLCFRIVDESEEPPLYPKSYFLDCDIFPPENWVFHDYGDGEYEALPPEFAARGFFEKLANGHAESLKTYKAYLELNFQM